MSFADLRSLRLLVVVVFTFLVGCGSAARPDDDGGGDADADVDADADADSDGGDRPVCPTGDDLVISDACVTQADCTKPNLCSIRGGVCVEERWICGQCDYCFFEREPFLLPDPMDFECDGADELCVER